MEVVLAVVGLVIGVLVVTGVADRFSLPAPILLLVVGFAVSFVPGVPGYELSPDLVLYLLLPPLLFAAALESSAVAIRQLVRPIVQLSVGLVLLTAFTVAVVVTAVDPSIPFAAALALGAIVAPPDAVAAVAVARRVGLPRRLVTVLEGESLFNDATSLVTLKVAIAAIGTTAIGWGSAIGEFAWAAIGGVALGAALGWLLSLIRRRVLRAGLGPAGTSALTITSLSLLSPFLAYALGELVHASGILVVVVSGLVLGFRSPSEVPAAVRLTENATWAALRFVLEGAVFALIGLQLRGILGALNEGESSDGSTYLVIGAVLVTVIVSRPLWISLIHLVSRLSSRRNPVTWSGVAAVSWAGMRGVVSLAAAQTLPMDTPHRAVLLAATVAVIIGTLVLQGLSLPWVIGRLGLSKDYSSDDERQRAQAHARASAAMMRRLDEVCRDEHLSRSQIDALRQWAASRDWRSGEDSDQDEIERSREFGRKVGQHTDWRRTLLAVERAEIVAMRNEGELSEPVLQTMQYDLDLEETLLERRTEAIDGHLAELPSEQDPDPDAGVRSATTSTREGPPQRPVTAAAQGLTDSTAGSVRQPLADDGPSDADLQGRTTDGPSPTVRRSSPGR